MSTGWRSTQVSTAEGRLRGTSRGDVVTWRGIPYAAPPVGPLRLRAPQPMAPWDGVREAKNWGNASSQTRLGTAIGVNQYQPISEDCLTLNVVAPAEVGDAALPVMVFIHGGGFVLGTSASPIYDGASLVRRGNVVFVSLNYRLGTLGFFDLTRFSTDERPIDSNLGLRDQVAALEWVQRNIAAFGGDPNNVTIFGESAGATAVSTLLAVPSAQSLFHKAIAQSTAGMWLEKRHTDPWALELVGMLGIDPENAAVGLEQAATKPLGKYGNILAKLVADRTPGLLPFGPVVDGSFLPEHPVAALAAGRGNRVPLIIGTNRREGAFFARVLDALPTNPVRIRTMFELTDPDAHDRITAAYPGYPAAPAAIDLGGDQTFWKPSLDLMDAHSRHAPTFAYRYDFAPRAFTLTGFGPTHATELLAVFGSYDTKLGRVLTVSGGKSGAQRVTDEVQGHWITFARYGTPGANWPPFDTETRATRIIDSRSRVLNDPNSDRRAVWGTYDGYANEGLLHQP